MHGDWKALIRLHDGSSLARRARSTCPPTRRSRPQAVPATAAFERAFVRRQGDPPARGEGRRRRADLLGYGIVLAITLSIIALNTWALVRLATVIEDAAPRARALPPHPRRAGAGAGGMSRAIHRRKEIRLHGHPVSYYEAGSGPVLAARARHHLQRGRLAQRAAGAGEALHGGRARPAGPRRLGQAARRLLARRLRQRASATCWPRSGTSARPSSATRWAAASRCSSPTSSPSACERLVLVSSGGLGKEVAPRPARRRRCRAPSIVLPVITRRGPRDVGPRRPRSGSSALGLRTRADVRGTALGLASLRERRRPPRVHPHRALDHRPRRPARQRPRPPLPRRRACRRCSSGATATR